MKLNNLYRSKIVTIDGVAGSGKSSVGHLLAKVLGFKALSSGQLYRAFAYFVVQKLSLQNKLLSFLEKPILDFDWESFFFQFDLREDPLSEGFLFFLDGKNISTELNSLEVEKVVPVTSTFPAVRDCILNLQRKIGADNNLVIDGRDCGSKVFPYASCRIFLTANLSIRASRVKGRMGLSLREAEVYLSRRDKIDEERSISPLVIPANAIVIDSSEESLFDTVKRIICLINYRI